MPRIKDVSVEATTPAADDFVPIDGSTHGVRKLHPGTAVTRDVPASGDAASDEVVLGNDTRLVSPPPSALSNLLDVVLSAPSPNDVLQFGTTRWVNRPPENLTDGGNF